MDLRPYQIDAVQAMAQHRRGICVAPAGSGKTIIAAALTNAIPHDSPFPPVVYWLAHTKEQREQAIEAVAIKTKADAWAEFRYFCYARNPNLARADVVIVDECHWGGCDMVQSILRTARPDARIYGFTATPKREDGIDITAIIGPVLYTVERDTLTEAGAVLKGEVRCIRHGIENSLEAEAGALAQKYYTNGMRWHDRQTGTDDQLKRALYRAVTQLGVKDNPERDAVIVRTACLHSFDSVIVLVDSKKHGLALAKQIPGAVMLFSGVSGRSAKIKAFQDGEIPCIVATSLADEGLDVPCANVLILAGSGKAFGKIIQRTGRVLRPSEGKTHGIIYDIFDAGHGMLRNQHWQRRRHYKKAGYEIKWWRHER